MQESQKENLSKLNEIPIPTEEYFDCYDPVDGILTFEKWESVHAQEMGKNPLKHIPQ